MNVGTVEVGGAWGECLVGTVTDVVGTALPSHLLTTFN